MAKTRNQKPLEWIREGECIVVTSHARNSKGYIYVNRNGRRVGLHRLVCERRHGRHDDLYPMHSCDNPPCIHPDHLTFGTNQQNRTDSVLKKRHAFGSRVGSAKLTEAEAFEIFHAEGSQRVIAGRYGIHQMTVCNIKRRKIWKHIPFAAQTAK